MNEAQYFEQFRGDPPLQRFIIRPVFTKWDGKTHYVPLDVRGGAYYAGSFVGFLHNVILEGQIVNWPTEKGLAMIHVPLDATVLGDHWNASNRGDD